MAFEYLMSYLILSNKTEQIREVSATNKNNSLIRKCRLFTKVYSTIINRHIIAYETVYHASIYNIDGCL